MLQLRLSVIFIFFASKSDIYSCCFNPAIFSELHEFSFECLFFCTWILSHDELWIVSYWIALNEKLIKNDFFYKAFLIPVFTLQWWYLILWLAESGLV